MSRRTLCVVACSLAVSAPSVSWASAVIESNDRLELNWSTLKLRYFGEANVGSSAEDYRATEKKAWHEGLSFATEAVRNLNIGANEPFASDPQKLSDDAKEAARQVSSKTYSFNTTYYANGTVRVFLESPLPKALETSAIHFRQKEAAEPGVTQYSGIVFRANQNLKPRATYQVVDESGAVLFDVKDMAQAAYARTLMGRWYRKPGPGELAEAVGKNPVTIPVSVSGGKFLVKKDVWDKAVEGHRSLLVNGTIAIALP